MISLNMETILDILIKLLEEQEEVTIEYTIEKSV